MNDIRATVRLFTTITLQPVLAQLTIWDKGEVLLSEKMQADWVSSKQYTSRIEKCMPTMAGCLKEACLIYNNLQSTFNSCSNYEEFDEILKASPLIIE